MKISTICQEVYPKSVSEQSNAEYCKKRIEMLNSYIWLPVNDFMNIGIFFAELKVCCS